MKTRTIEEMAQQIREFCAERDWDQFHGPKDLAIGLVTEASELLELFRFLKPEQVDAMIKEGKSRQAIGQELADVLFFLLRFADRFDFSLYQELESKMKLNAKKYPVDEFRGQNHKYNRTPVE